MANGSIARRYARAIFDLGVQDNNLDRIGTDLRDLAASMKSSPELAESLTNPVMRRSDRKKILDAVLTRMGATVTTKNLVSLLLERERVESVPDIAREITAMIEAKAGRVSVEVTSATPLAGDQLAKITASLEKLAGKKVDVVQKQDANLLGGVIAKLGDIVYDGSLRTQLRGLRDELSK